MTYDLGRFQPRIMGAYSSGTNYEKLDVVYYNGGSYICKSDSVTGKVPTNTTYWQQLAAPGVATMTEQQKQEIIASLVAQGVIIDTNYNTFSTAEKEKLAGLGTPNNGTLTIKRNGVTVGTFGADQQGNATIDIPVPTTLRELGADGELYSLPDIVDDKETKDAELLNVKQNTTYNFDMPLTSLAITSLGYDFNDVSNMRKQPATVIFHTGADTFRITIPNGCVANYLGTKKNSWYMLSIHGRFFTLIEYYDPSKGGLPYSLPFILGK